MFGQNGTSWILCCRTTSFTATGVYYESLGHGMEYDYCIVSQEYLDASKENGRINLYGEDIPVSELKPVATLLTGMKAILWRNEIESEANSFNITNLADFQARAENDPSRPLGQGSTFSSRNSTDWIHLADNSETTELVRWLPAVRSSAFSWGSLVTVTNPTKDTISFQEVQFGMIDAGTLSKVQQKNNASEDDFAQFTNDIYQCVQLQRQDAELQKQADVRRVEEQKQMQQKQKEAEAPPFNLLFCISALFVGISCLGFGYKDRLVASPELFNLKKYSRVCGWTFMVFAFFQNPLIGLACPVICLIQRFGGVCPSCSRIVAGEPMGIKLVDYEVKYKSVKREEYVKNQRGETVFTIDRGYESVPYEIKTHRHHYRCPICRHQWTELKKTEK